MGEETLTLSRVQKRFRDHQFYSKCCRFRKSAFIRTIENRAQYRNFSLLGKVRLIQ
jgi:hypothetical protein